MIGVHRFTKGVKQPGFSYGSLSGLLSLNGFDYRWIPELGGFRRFNVDVENCGIANCFKSSVFRAYATYVLDVMENHRASGLLMRYYRSMCSSYSL